METKKNLCQRNRKRKQYILLSGRWTEREREREKNNIEKKKMSKKSEKRKNVRRKRKNARMEGKRSVCALCMWVREIVFERERWRKGEDRE